MDPRTAYLSYEDRWLLELVYKCYKNDECLDQTNVQGDFSLIGAEFINFISTVLTCRLVRKAREAGLLDKMSFDSLMDDLNSSWRQTSENEDAPRTDDGKWVHTLANVFESLEALHLSVPVPKPAPKKRDRPRTKQDVVKPKRPRGRPKKTDTPAGLL